MFTYVFLSHHSHPPKAVWKWKYVASFSYRGGRIAEGFREGSEKMLPKRAPGTIYQVWEAGEFTRCFICFCTFSTLSASLLWKFSTTKLNQTWMGIFLRNHSVKTVRFGRLAPGGDELGLAWGGGERRERRRKKYVGVGGIGELRELIACWRDAPFEIILNQEPLSQLQGQINYFFPHFCQSPHPTFHK